MGRLVAQEGRIIPFRELAGFHAAVVVPWSPELCMLRHLFKMAVPIFVPDRGLLRNLVHVSNSRLLPYPYFLPMPQSHRQVVEDQHPYDPFLDTDRRPSDPLGVAARSYWAEYSEYLLLPMLQYFASGAGLLVSLSKMDGVRVSARMRSAYLQDMEEMHSFWLSALTPLLRKVSS